NSDGRRRRRGANTRDRFAAHSSPLQWNLLRYVDQLRRRLPALAGLGRDALARRCDLRRVGTVLLYPGFGKWNDLEQHTSTGEISGAPLHLEFYAGQRGVSAAGGAGGGGRGGG